MRKFALFCASLALVVRCMAKKDIPMNQEVEGMRVRNIKTRLIGLGEDPVEVEAILDKRILKNMLTERLWEQYQDELATQNWATFILVAKFVGGLLLAALAYAPVSGFIYGAIYRFPTLPYHQRLYYP